MLRLLLVLSPLVASAQVEMESCAMLFQAEEAARRFAPAISRAAPPSNKPQTDPLLQLASNWFSIDLTTIKTEGRSVLATLANEQLWDALAQMGIQAVELKNLKLESGTLVSLNFNPKWGTDEEYAALAEAAMRRKIHLIGALIGASTTKGADFALALKNYRDYPGLYSLIEIEAKDWPLLPNVAPKAFSANVPWLTLQTLHKMGYVPKEFITYVKTSDWNATEPITGLDGKARRWIYLRDGKGDPKLDWLRPSYASERLAVGNGLLNLYRLGQRIMGLESSLPNSARKELSLAVRKMGAFSTAHLKGGISSFAEKSADLNYDHLTPIAAFHALVAEDAEALRLLYRLMLDQGIQPKTLIHPLHPFRDSSCDWAEFLASPRKKYQYFEQEMTGEALRNRLLQEDVYQMTGQSTGKQLPLSTWAAACDGAFAFEELNKRRSIVMELHLLIAKFFAWQPGAFSLSAEDLLGTTSPEEPIDLIGPNSKSLYSSLTTQSQTSSSFASNIRAILLPRREFSLERAELIDVPCSPHKGLLILRYRLPESGFTALLAVNFGRQKVAQTFESLEYAKTTAINLFERRAENKLFDSSLFQLKLDPLSAKLILFQPTYYK